MEILYRDIPWRSVAEILPRGLLHNLAKRAFIERLYRDLARTPLMEILYRDIPWRSVAEILPRGLLHKSCQESFYREVVRRSHKEILARDLL